jgi:lysophospholipase L1-like esterase
MSLSRAGRMLVAVGIAVPALALGWAAHDWRQGKLALLVPTEAVLAPRPAAGDATGGVLLFGDSRVAHWAPLPERPFPVIRHGHSGESAIRLPASFEAALDRHRPGLAIVQAGVNDAVAAALAPAGVRAAAQDDAQDAFARMAAAARARGVRLLILKPLPPVRPGLARRIAGRGQVEPWLAELSAALPAIAAAHGAEVADPLPLLAASADAVPDSFRADAVHLTPAAYARLNALIPETLP